jgi:hypothetical protein
MSKGGAGKVYFVLYLAVILELLIIFIERDEAEEGLRRQQQQAIQIVQTILSQLQTGSGATGITATPKDNIVLNEKEPQANVRNYTVTVAVGDPKAQSVVNGKVIRGDDVAKLEYNVSHIGNPDIEEAELGPDSTDIQNGNSIFRAELGSEIGSLTVPRQISGSSIPADVTDKYFTLNEELTNEQLARGRRVKVFSVNFKPNQGPGWYRLRFASNTNKILGVTGEPKDDDTVRIGNIKLTVKQLRQVQKVLRKERGGDGQTSQVEKYIDQLLTADAYKSLPENQGFTSFNVRVTRPELPPPAQPFASIAVPRDTIYWYNAAPFTVPVTLGPKEARKEVSGGARLVETDPQRNLYTATIEAPQQGVLTVTAKATNASMVESDEKVLVVEKPELKAANARGNGTKAWRGLNAVIGAQYDPSTDWASPYIPDDHYQTVVAIKGNEVLNRPGTSHRNIPADQAKGLMITEGTKAEDIVANVYWKPNGTPDRSKWVLLLSSQPGPAVIPLEDKLTVSYRRPELITEIYDHVVQLNPRNKSWKSPEFQMVQRIGNTEAGVSATAQCAECDKDGVNIELEQMDDRTGQLKLSVNDLNTLIKNKINGKRYDVEITLRGKGAPRTEVMTVTLTVSPR